MPLFIAELHPVGSSYVEVSRGSIMNSKTWNSDPLMQTATRFKRDNVKSDSLDAFHQRKYEHGRPVDVNDVRLFKSEVKSFDGCHLVSNRTGGEVERDLLHVFGYIRGCIGPICLRQQSRVTVVLDAGLLDQPAINCGAGGLGRVVSLNPRQLLGLSSVLSIRSHVVC
ncbi:hypothetical protein AC1031_017969 [Aphanomyces cochlioides]|nr:hypothetical protein AC1031_017969 [Aphanomyces cochlioides]